LKISESELERLAKNPKVREGLAKKGLLSEEETKETIDLVDVKEDEEYRKQYQKVYTYFDLVWARKPLRAWFVAKVMATFNDWINKEIEAVKRDKK